MAAYDYKIAALLLNDESSVSELQTHFKSAAICPNPKLVNGTTVLHSAASLGHDNLVKLLIIKLQANPNIADNNGRTPLIVASKKGNDGIVSTLLQAGADPNIADYNGRTPLIYIAGSENGHANILFLLYFKLVLILT